MMNQQNDPNTVRGRVRVIKLRHRTAPEPNGCRWCGVSLRIHDYRQGGPKGWHVWTAPTIRQVTARTKARVVDTFWPWSADVDR